MSNYRDKADWIAGFLRNKDVLYVGSVELDLENLEKHRQLQKQLAPLCSSLTGVYVTDAQARLLREEGLSAVQADPETMDLGRSFDVVIAADMIEHLSNTGRFLDRVSHHLVQGGRFLVTTPNPTSFVRVIELLVLGRAKANVEHTCWYSAQVFDQLAARSGLRVSSVVFIDEMHRYHRTDNPARPMGLLKKFATRITVGVNAILCRMRPQLAETFGFVLEHDQPTGTGPRADTGTGIRG